MTANLRRRRARGERGAVLVEATLVLPLMMMIVWGIIEFGFGWKDKMTVETAAMSGARTAANLGNDPLADYNALKTTVSALSGVPAANIDYIVIFNAANPITTNCAAGTPSSVGTSQCNVYLPSTFAWPSSSFGCGSGKPDNNWCPIGRSQTQATASYVGVYVRIHRPLITSEFGSSIPSITATAVSRVEP
jgi:hypothetical protein